ncbi:MAG: FkbM family methyltransferase [Caldilineales bacterium]|nr:FkbM family methyltransferase [Caldilineales bacterium]
MRVPQRFHVVAPWLSARLRQQTNVPASEMLRFLRQAPRHVRARNWIRDIEEDGDYLKICFVDLDSPLYWPKSEDVWSLWMLINEQYDTNDWHHYEISQTAVRADDVVVDCGAAEGLFALRAVRRCQQVYVFEPNPVFLDALHLTFAASPNVEIFPYAAGERRGSARLVLDGERSRFGEESGFLCEIRSLDEMLLHRTPPVSYLKADVEGAEQALLAGATEIIRTHKPRVAITVYHDPNDVAEMMAFLRSQNPDYQFITKGIVASGKPVMLHAW